MRSSVFFATRLRFAFKACVFEVLDMAVTLRLAFQAVASMRFLPQVSSQNGDVGEWECAQTVLKSFQTCGVV